MSDESKSTKTFEFPMMPILGLDVGKDLGELSAGQKQMENNIQRLEVRIDAVDAKLDAIGAKFEAKTDKMANALHRLDERTKNLSMVTWGGIVVLLIAIIAQKLL